MSDVPKSNSKNKTSKSNGANNKKNAANPTDASNSSSSESATDNQSLEEKKLDIPKADGSNMDENSEVLVNAAFQYDVSLPRIEYDAAPTTSTTNNKPNVSNDTNLSEEHLQPKHRLRSSSIIERDLTIPTRSQRYEVNEHPLILDFSEERERNLYIVSNPKIAHDEYEKESMVPGEIFIYNFENFEDERPRLGSRIDVKALIDTLGRLKYNIRKDMIYHDLTKAEVLASIQSARDSFPTEAKPNCLMVFFLTHGESNNIISTKDDKLSVEEIIQSFCCEALQGVPKWFTFLACKEPKYAMTDTKIVANQTFMNRLPDDVIVYYSTTEGNYSARVPEEGTWVIQELCHNMNAYGRRDELFTILTRTNKCVANNYYGFCKDVNEDHRQCPVIVSTLTKKFYLTNSKERTALLEILEEIKEIQEEVEKLKNR